MKAVVCQDARLDVVELPDPEPGEGQLVLDVTRCGICGSDLHARHYANTQADLLAEAGYDGFARSHEKVVFGHEFCGTIAEHGPGTSKKNRTGTPVVALPLVRMPNGMHAIGLSASAPGAYAERVLVEEALMMPVPNGLSPEVAVLAEPMAIGHHAVNRSEITRKDAAVVIGCGPVGLAIICLLRRWRWASSRMRSGWVDCHHSSILLVSKSCGSELPTSTTSQTPPRLARQRLQGRAVGARDFVLGRGAFLEQNLGELAQQLHEVRAGLLGRADEAESGSGHGEGRTQEVTTSAQRAPGGGR